MRNKNIAILEAEKLKNLICEKYNLDFIKIKVKETLRGRAYYNNRIITIPFWAYSEGLNYFHYYILHELSHFINYDMNKSYGHNKKFKTIEKNLLKDFDLVPIYKRVYIKALKNKSGNLVWKKKDLI